MKTTGADQPAHAARTTDPRRERRGATTHDPWSGEAERRFLSLFEGDLLDDDAGRHEILRTSLRACASL